jgi:UDP:flavonoid glycosyltransferase YjiC (YdhE family)
MGKLLFFCAPEYGHMNMSIAIGKAILDRSARSHQVYFIVDENWKKLLFNIDSRFMPLVFKTPDPPKTEDGREGVPVPLQLVELTHPFGSLDRVGRNKLFARLLVKIIDFCESIQDDVDRLVDEIKPDLILIDHFALQPNLVNKGIPWSHLYSVTLNIFRHPKLPPPLVQCESLATHTWPAKALEYKEVFGAVHERHHKWLRRNNVSLPPEDSFYFESPHFNVYMYPKELDYGVTDLPGEWSRIDAPILNNVKTALDVPDEFLKLQGELIYFSMGSFLSMNVRLMQRLINMLRGLPFKFIISAGPMMQMIDFPPNCHAAIFIDQKNVLQHVKMIISHCGNNTTSECFYYGVRMLPLPIYGDQPDNAIRMHELGYAVAPLDPFTVTEEKMHEAIHSTLALDFKVGPDPVVAFSRFDSVIKKVTSYLE